MKIEVNMYIRTQFGIQKIIKLETDYVNYSTNPIPYNVQEILFIITNKSKLQQFEIIGKPSYDLIDLIEVGDLVNGHLVVDIKNDEYIIEIGLESDKLINHYINKEHIKTILTKEQFLANEYKVEV